MIEIGLYLSIANPPLSDDMDRCTAETLVKMWRSPKSIAKPHEPPARNRRS